MISLKNSVWAFVLVLLPLLYGCGEFEPGGSAAREVVWHAIYNAGNREAMSGGLYSAKMPDGNFAVVASATWQGMESPFLSAFLVIDGKAHTVNALAIDAAPNAPRAPEGTNFQTLLEMVAAAN